MPKAYASAVIPAKVDEVWTFVRDYTNLATWHPTIETSEIESGDPGSPGCIRHLTGPGGAVFRERLLALSDLDRTFTYEFVESPFPVRSYRSTLRLAPITESGNTFGEWYAWYESEAADEESMTKIFSQAVFGTGLEALQKHFA